MVDELENPFEGLDKLFEEAAVDPLDNLGSICWRLYGPKVVVGHNSVDGYYFIKWDVEGVSPPTDLLAFVQEHEENTNLEKAKNIRELRTAMLTASDWTQLGDSPLSAEKKDAWKAYRQALRDISKQEGFPNNITWPEAP